MEEASPPRPSSLSSPRESTRSSQQGCKVHWLLHDRHAVEKMGGRFVSEEDLKKERESWYGMCMHEVRNLETAAFARIRQVEEAASRQIDEAASRLQSELSKNLLQQTEVTAVEAAIADLRNELGAERERQDLQAETTRLALSDFRHDLSALQVVQLQALQEQASRSSSDLSRGIQEVTAVIAASQGSLKADLQQEVEALHRDLEKEHSLSDKHFAKMKSVEDNCRVLSVRLDESQRMIVGLKQEMAQHVVDERLHAERLGLAEQQLATGQSTEGPVLPTQPEAAEAVGRPGAAGQCALLERQLGSALARVEQLEQQMPVGSAALTSAKDVAALVARLETVETLCLSTVPAADGGRVARTAGAPADGDASHQDLTQLLAPLEVLRGQVERLEQDLAEERSERYRGLADVGRLTEDVAKAAAATIERAEKRFSEEFLAGRGELRKVGEKQAPGAEEGANADACRLETASTASSEDVQRVLDKGFARRVGELDAELRAELAGRVRSLAAELRGELLAEVATRAASQEARAGALEARLGGELQHLGAELRSRLVELEASRPGGRVEALEREVKKASLTCQALLEERSNKKAAASAIEAIEQDVRRALHVGRAGSAVHPKAADGATAPMPMPRSGSAVSSSTQRRREASSHSRGRFGEASPTPALSEQACRATASPVGSLEVPSVTESGPTAEPLGEAPELSEELKQRLEGLVSAVHRTLSRPQRPGSRPAEAEAGQAPASPARPAWQGADAPWRWSPAHFPASPRRAASPCAGGLEAEPASRLRMTADEPGGASLAVPVSLEGAVPPGSEPGASWAERPRCCDSDAESGSQHGVGAATPGAPLRQPLLARGFGPPGFASCGESSPGPAPEAALARLRAAPSSVAAGRAAPSEAGPLGCQLVARPASRLARASISGPVARVWQVSPQQGQQQQPPRVPSGSFIVPPS
mmetsp:Transcript_5979/g.18559  ORF Transcript_5979/g.18559 Transcript_5979/m.18559 type:complete len:943 (-) Transcript_5979:116-2944(-)